MTRAEERAQKAAAERRRRAEGKIDYHERNKDRWGLRPHSFKGHSPHRATRADIAARLAEVPEDTRSLTALVMGDPLPGRSVLDRERARP